MNEVPSRLATYMSHKHYLHATKLLVEAVTLGRDTLEGVESLKELSTELEERKEVMTHQNNHNPLISLYLQQLHLQLFAELKEHLYTKPSQLVLTLRRQGSGRDGFPINSPLQRSTELRSSGRNRSALFRNNFDDESYVSKHQLNVLYWLSLL